MRSLVGMVVVITGASRGVGAVAARLFALEGAKVVLNGRDENRLREVADRLEVAAERYLRVVADIGQPDGMKRLVRAAVERFGRIDVFVNNAGLGVRKPITETTEAEWDLMFDVNVKAVYRSFQVLIPLMRHQGGGQIINVSTLASRTGRANLGAYGASKGALNVLCEAVGDELRNEGIKVSLLLPGSIGTGFLTHTGEDRTPSPADKPRMTAEQVARKVVELAKEDPGVWTSSTEMRPLRTK